MVHGEILAQASPAWLSHVPLPTNSILKQAYPKDTEIKMVELNQFMTQLDMSKYPEPLKQPPGNHPEIQNVMKQIDWSKVPKIQPRKVNNFMLDTASYNTAADPDCWWSASTCKKPKLDYLPEDVYYCPQSGHWGLNYDDGPYKKWYPINEEDKQFDQPRFYNYLLQQEKQKATLFFVGSNVVKFPDAAQRALNDGHTICSHTWSHPQMTTLTDEEIVGQLYWTHRAIKEVLGITPKCWRPPFGDVDDRVRAIAWQMGMRTFLWDQDSFDWNMYGGPSQGKLTAEVVDGYFQKWIEKQVNQKDVETRGHITLEHENSNSTILTAEKWLPKLQKSFKVMPIHQCLDDAHPYWEKQWVYPTLSNPTPTTNSNNDDKTNNPSSGQNSNPSPSALLTLSSSSSFNCVLSFYTFICIFLAFYFF
ncbi:hypothetical protein BJ944DRAFT_170057 [Cunninghamella echinulata]|nr:hypothetical protein BJ944DRAFT_170057 [Cunninghamella echinulata]